MNYQPKVVRCRLKTGGKTIQEIAKELKRIRELMEKAEGEK